MKDELVLYRLDDFAEHVEVRIDEKRETIWLTQQQIADLFGTKRPAITKHLSAIFYTGELDEEVVSSILEHTTLHGALRQKTQKTRVKYYSLDAVLAVGYRVNSGRATQFRIWVTRMKLTSRKVAKSQSRKEQGMDNFSLVSSSVVKDSLTSAIA